MNLEVTSQQTLHNCHPLSDEQILKTTGIRFPQTAVGVETSVVEGFDSDDWHVKILQGIAVHLNGVARARDFIGHKIMASIEKVTTTQNQLRVIWGPQERATSQSAATIISEQERQSMSDDGSASPPKQVDPRKQIARELWERLAKSRPGPDNKDLIFLARFVPLLSTSATKTLLSRKLNLEEVKELLQHVPKAKEAATKLALRMPPEDVSEEDLRFVFTQSRSVEAAKILLKRFPNDANIGLIERTIDDMADVIEKMQQQEPTRDVLREIERKL